ncbi:MAG: cell division ATPase MinD [Candidatus Pacearchaeota archaeon]|nr:cell division ATPase MinD [Candidatus Pacearchaeota archaeon]
MKIITITSGKGGVGKTTTAINLGVALNSFGKEVIVVDANLTTPNVGLHLGAPIVPVNLNHVMIGKANVSDAIYEHESGTKIIPSSLSVRELKRLNHKKLKDVARKLQGMADYVIFDSAAGLGEEAVASIDVADELIIVTNPEITAVTDALKAIKMAEDMGKKVKGVIVTKTTGNKNEMAISNIKEMLDVPLLGVVPNDKNVLASLRNKDAIFHCFPYSKASRAYRKIASRIANISYKEPTFMQRVFGR